MAKVQEIGPYSAYAIAVKYGYKGTEEEWVQEQEANRKAAEAAAAAAEQSAKNAAASASGAAQSGQQAVQSVKDAQTAAEQAIDTAKQQAVQTVKDEGSAQTRALNDAAEDHKNELKSIASHPPRPNTATGKWQTWNAETGAYQDTDALYQGGYYTPAVSDDGVLTWQGSQPEMPAIPGANVKGPKGDKGDPGLGVPTPTTSDAGKVPVVNAEGTGYELGDPQVDAYSKSESDARYAPIAAAIRPTANGNPVNITDSVEWPLQGLKVYGKSTQNGTPSPENPVPIVSAGDSGEIDINVTTGNLFPESVNIGDYETSSCGASYSDNVITLTVKTAGGYRQLSPIHIPPNLIGKNVWIKADEIISSNKANVPFCVIRTYESSESLNGDQIRSLDVDINGVSPILIPDTGVEKDARIIICVNRNNTANVGDTVELKGFRIVLRDDIPYQPYQSQSLTIFTPSGLLGIPVDSGGNYTDAEGRQRICDVVDFDLKSLVGNVAKKIFTGDEFFDLGERDISTNQLGGVFFTPMDASILQTAKGGLCNYYRYSKIKSDIRNNSGCFDFNYDQFRFSAKGYDSADDFKAHLKSMYNSGNPVTVFYPTVSIVNTALSPEELAAYRALHTYDGATVVSTAEDVAGIEVRYVADGEKYIDRKISEAIASAAETKLAAYDTLSGAIHEGVNEA